MALCSNSLCFCRIIFDPVAAEQKGSLHIPFLQAIQQPAGKSARWTIVKGQSYILRSSIRPDGNNQHQHTKKARKNSPQLNHNLSVLFDGEEKMGYDK